MCWNYFKFENTVDKEPAAFGRLCVETISPWLNCISNLPAAFGRLCVETICERLQDFGSANQPPSGGCVLKQCLECVVFPCLVPAAFGRLCVETITNCFMRVIRFQPPSGGCVLKHEDSLPKVTGKGPAAFGRLCVETQNSTPRAPTCQPAAFGRLCVETPYGSSVSCRMSQPPSGGCVLKL